MNLSNSLLQDLHINLLTIIIPVLGFILTFHRKMLYHNDLIVEMLEMVLEELKELPRAPHNEKIDSVINGLEEVIIQLKEIRSN